MANDNERQIKRQKAKSKNERKERLSPPSPHREWQFWPLPYPMPFAVLPFAF
jgi:hypothetical protein